MKKTLTLFSLMLLSILTASAQYYYLPNLLAGQNPGNLNNDNEYPVGGGLPTGWTIVRASSAVPAWSANQTIPFAFNFNGNPVTSYKVSTTGIVTFDVASVLAAPSSAAQALPSALIPDNSICVWGLQGTATNDNVVVKTFGSAPNRQYWIFFSSYSIPSNVNGWTYWSIVLEETTNNIYIVDQRTSGTLNMSLGVQINNTTATSVSGSPSVGSLASTDPSPVDNSFYQFVYGTQAINEAELTSLSYNQFVVSPTSVNIGGTITNFGAANINTIAIKYESAGVTYTDTKTGLNVPFGAVYSFAHATPLSIPTSGNYPIKVWIELANDNNHTNDTISGAVGALSFLTTKRVVFEEATGTWCGWCPRGAVFMDSLKVLHPNDAMLIAVHNSDPMVVASYDAGIGQLIGGYPSGLVDRKDNDVDPSTFISEYNQRIQDVAPCDINVVATYDPNNNSAYITVSATMAIELTGDYRFNAVITEDDVTGTASSWNQSNYYSNQSQNIPLQGAGHNWQLEPNPVLAANMVYDHVGRAILGGWNGVPNSLPTTVTPNSTYSWGFSYQIPATFDVSQLMVIGWVQSIATGNILNANFSTVVTGIKNPENDAFGISVFPNPVTASNGKVKLNLKKDAKVNFEIMDIMGKIVRSNQSDLNAGEYIYPLNLENLSNGIYSVRVTSGSESLTQKIILNK